jgi:hypothetical protein
MVKALLLVAAGLGIGLAVALWMHAEIGAPAVARVAAGTTALAATNTGDPRLEELRTALSAEVERRAALEARVAALGDELAALRTRPAAGNAGAPAQATPPAADASGPPPFARGGPFRREAPGSQVDALVGAGFPPDRAAWIERRATE